jgi:hypothetical protein
MRSKKKILLIVVAYQVIPLFLITAWIMPVFFDLFGVSWNDRTWRLYAATAGGWIILEAPLVIFVGIRIARRAKKEPNQLLQPNAGAAPFADEALPPRG